MTDTEKSLREMLMHNAQEVDRLCAENERLRAALEDIVNFKVFGFAITDTHTGKDVFCEGTNRFVREEDVVKMRGVARAALEGKQ